MSLYSCLYVPFGFCLGVWLIIRRCSRINRTRSILVLLLVVVVFLAFALLNYSSRRREHDGLKETVGYEGDELVSTAATAVRRAAFRPAVSLDTRNYRLSQPNCSALALGDRREVLLVKRMLYKEARPPIPNRYFADADPKSSCQFLSLDRYPDRPHSAYEERRPIAYAIGVKERAETVERFIRATYAPQNTYCLYIINDDSTTMSSSFDGGELLLALRHISYCFPNVVLTTGTNEPRMPYRSCLGYLSAYFNWKHVLMIAENDFPLGTNRQIVDWVEKSAEIWSRKKRQISDDRPPLLPPLTKSNDYSGYMITRKMAEMAAQGRADLRFSAVDGAIELELLKEKHGFLELKIRFDKFCQSPTEPNCFLESSDLPWLLNQSYLFARKIDLQTDYVIVKCIEQKIRKQRKKEL